MANPLSPGNRAVDYASTPEIDVIGRAREKGANGRLCRDQRGRVEPLNLVCGDDALRPGAGPLDDRLAVEIAPIPQPNDIT